VSGPFLYALLSRYSKAAAWPPSNWPQPVPSAAIEIVDVDSLTTVNAFSIGSREPTALELVGGELYVVDPSRNEVVVLRGWGAYVSTLSVSPAPSDCVASPDGSRIYVAGSGAIDVIETSPLRVAQSVPVQSFAASGVTISEDGRTVVAVGERSGTGIALVLDTTALSVREVPLAGVHAALDAAFIEPDLALVWTGSSFLQVNTSSATQLSAATVPTSG
jgi:DNA-binding beta-propeller fold protein YncE